MESELACAKTNSDDWRDLTVSKGTKKNNTYLITGWINNLYIPAIILQITNIDYDSIRVIVML
jgi:hypothetical protein